MRGPAFPPLKQGARPHLVAAHSSPPTSSIPSTAHLFSVGCALPGLSRRQSDVADELAQLWRLKGASLGRWRRIVAGTCIENRHGVAPLEDIVRLSTGERMRLYEAHSPQLAAEASRSAIHSAGVTPHQITDLIVVSCTGFSAPGLDLALIESLGFMPTTRRCTIGFMGCFGAISGLRAAVGACCADPNAIALVVCCELCSLHVPAMPTVQDMVASALFGDGAAAAVVAGANAFGRLRETASGSARDASFGQLTLGHSRVLPEGRDWMTWRITDAGFAMTLDKAVAGALRSALPQFVVQAIAHDPRTFIVHPGGPGILDAVEDALNLKSAHDIAASWNTLHRVGNVSSATVLFVLDELARAGRLSHPALLLAFGPGLTIDSIALLSE